MFAGTGVKATEPSRLISGAVLDPYMFAVSDAGQTVDPFAGLGIVTTAPLKNVLEASKMLAPITI